MATRTRTVAKCRLTTESLTTANRSGFREYGDGQWLCSRTREFPLPNRTLICSLTALKAGAAGVFADNGVSGSTIERPQLSKAMERLEPGDVLTVWKLDRLGRNTRDVLYVVENIRGQGAGFRSLTEGRDTTGPMGTAMLTIMAAFAQLERHTMIAPGQDSLRQRLTTVAAEGPGKWTPQTLPGPRNSKAKESAQPTSARCSESPAPRSTGTSFKRHKGKASFGKPAPQPNGARGTLPFATASAYSLTSRVREASSEMAHLGPTQ